MARTTWRRVCLIGSAAVVAVLVVTAAMLGAHPFKGEFGATGEPKTCGSVWGLRNVEDLNAATCAQDLRDRVTLVSIVLGVAFATGAVGMVDVASMRNARASRGRKVGCALSLVGASAAVAVMLIAVGRHLIWSVSGA